MILCVRVCACVLCVCVCVCDFVSVRVRARVCDFVMSGLVLLFVSVGEV